MQNICNAIIWIGSYMLAGMFGEALGREWGCGRWLTVAFLAVFSIVLYISFKKGGTINEYKLGKIDASARSMLLPYIPLLIPICLQFVCGIESDLAADSIIVCILLMLFVAFSEESLFRGKLLHDLAKVKTPIFAVICSSLVFALVHLINLTNGMTFFAVAFQIVSAFCCGVILSLLVLETKTIWPCILFHWIFNICGNLAYSTDISQIVCTLCFFVLAIVYCLRYKMKNTDAKE